MLACGPAFFFSAFLWSFSLPLPLGGGAGFWVLFFLGLSGLLCSSTGGSRWPSRASLGLCRCRFPTRFTKSHTGLTRAFPVSFILPLWGKAGLTSQLVPANLHEFAHNRLTQRQQGLFGASLVLLPSSFPKTARRATQSRVWFHRFFLMRFGSGKATKSRSSLYSIASWMGRIV